MTLSTPQTRLQRVCEHLQPVHTSGTTQPPLVKQRRRAVIVAGCRTPFLKSFTDFLPLSSIDLGCSAIRGLIQQTSLPPTAIDSVIFGNVVQTTSAPNTAREIILDLKLPRSIPGTTVSIACLSGLETVYLAVAQIESGAVDECIIAGGTDSLSNAEMPLPRHVTQSLAVYTMGGGNKSGWTGYYNMLMGMGSPLTWFPTAPSISERSTGHVMGWHADVTAELHQITRESQDFYSVESHRKAAAALKAGDVAADITPVTLKGGKVIKADSLIRTSIDVKKLAALAPAFRPKPAGTITAASASALTDGASAVLVMSEAKAAELGYPTDISVRAYARCGFEPNPQLLMAPAIAIPLALRQAQLTLADIDLFEIHEAFAAQVLTTLKVLNDESFYEKYGQEHKLHAVGQIDTNKLNVLGGSLAYGHPFAATGGRIVTGLARQMRKRGARFGLISICAAGGIGGVMILEYTPSQQPNTQTKSVDTSTMP